MIHKVLLELLGHAFCTSKNTKKNDPMGFA
jgi:hypothetical protein